MSATSERPRATPTSPAGARTRPTKVLTNRDLERMVDTNDEWIVQRTGIRERRVAAAHETTASMAAVGVERAIRTRRTRARRDRPDPARDADARLLDALDRRPRQGGDRQHEGRRDGRGRRVLRLRLRLRHRRRLHHERAREPRRSSSVRNCCRGSWTTPTAARASCSAMAPARSCCRPRTRGAAASGIEMTTEPTGRVHDLAARRWREELRRVAATHRPRRALHPHGGQRDLSIRDQDDGDDGARRRSSGPASRPTRSTSSSRTRPTSGSSRRWPRASTCRWRGCSSTSTGTATPRPRPCRSPWPRPSNEGRVKVGDNVVIVAFGAGLTCGRHGHRVDGRPGPRHRGRRRVRPEDLPGARAGGLELGRPDPGAPAPMLMAQPDRRRPARRCGARRARRTRRPPPVVPSTGIVDDGKTARPGRRPSTGLCRRPVPPAPVRQVPPARRHPAATGPGPGRRRDDGVLGTARLRRRPGDRGRAAESHGAALQLLQHHVHRG